MIENRHGKKRDKAIENRHEMAKDRIQISCGAMPSSSLQLNIKHTGVPWEETAYNVRPAGDL